MNSKNKTDRLTGKQASFVDKYLGEARFNASLAAKLAGYKATSAHSFEAIGSENLRKPLVRKTIDEYFRMSRMTSDEVLGELSELARGTSKDKIRALALLSSHYGILEGAGRNHNGNGGDGPIEINVVYTNEVTDAINKVYGRSISNEERAERIVEIVKTAKQWHEEADQYNEGVRTNNQRLETFWKGLFERFKDSPEATEALTLLHNEVHLDCKENPCDHCKSEAEARGPIEPEIIPPDRRLQPAAIERLMREISDDPSTPASPPPVQAMPVSLPETKGASQVHEEPPAVPEERVRPYGFCIRVDSDEAERIKERDRNGFHRDLRMY